MDEAAVLALADSCSNVGRWGPNDELGTLNLITADKMLAALQSVRSARVVPLGYDLLVAGRSRQTPSSATLSPRYAPPAAPIDAHDELTLNVHGYEATHLDALGHIFLDGQAWGGRDVDDVVHPTGLRFGSILPAAVHGIITRGVLLDVAGSRGVASLEPDDGISAADLDRAAAHAGVTIEPGDAVVVHSGHAASRVLEGSDHDETAPHAGVLPEVLPWLHDHGVAVYAGDCIERRPSGYARMPMPLHQIGLVRMGLCIIDVVDTEALVTACEAEGRSEFLLVASPLRVPGGTGSAVNPLAVF